MYQNKPNNSKNKKYFTKFSKYTWILAGIIVLASIVRLYYFPFEVPLSSDALYYFWYSSDIFQIEKLPSDWTPANTGWPIFVSTIFSIVNINDIEIQMSIQRGLSVLISIVTSISVYFLCKKFVSKFNKINDWSFVRRGWWD